MPLLAHLVGPSKQVENSDHLLKRAQALFDGHGDAMDTHDRDLALSLLQQYANLSSTNLTCSNTEKLQRPSTRPRDQVSSHSNQASATVLR